MIRIHEIKLNTNESEDILLSRVESRLRLPKGSIRSVRIARESLDAREKPEIYRVFSLDLISNKSDDYLIGACKRAKIKYDTVKEMKFNIPDYRTVPGLKRPVIAGFGPCGMFAGLVLAKAGLKPVILERGASMDKRIRLVEGFWSKNAKGPDFDTNVQFGEGGAGTFSDGKLTTGTKSPYSRFILENFVDFGASPKILYKQKPHIGSDVLRTVVVGLRKEIERLGGELHFETKLTGIEFEQTAGGKRLCAVVADNEKRFETDCLIMGLGHSARDTVRALYSEGLLMEQKPFSMGVRIEHEQALIDKAQLAAKHKDLGLEAADYKLNVKTSGGRGVYTFCMCPGGYVINASSHRECVVTNGMSNSGRDGSHANSALLCDIRTSDYENEHPLAGINFQEKYEHLAFIAGGSNYSLPSEKLSDFENKKTAGLMDSCLPGYVCEALREALPLLDKKLKGFNCPNATLYGIESRSSSPVRIKRDAESLLALASDETVIKGLYPAGEGAGYAGGIMSAAADGIKAAMSYLASLGEQVNP